MRDTKRSGLPSRGVTDRIGGRIPDRIAGMPKIILRLNVMARVRRGMRAVASVVAARRRRVINDGVEQAAAQSAQEPARQTRQPEAHRMSTAEIMKADVCMDAAVRVLSVTV